MRKILVFIAAASLLSGLAPGICTAGTSLGLKIDDSGVKSFYLAIGDQYHAPEAQLQVVHERHLPNEEVPVLFFIANKANVSPETILKLRLAGKSWMDISLQFHLNAGTFYVDAGDVSGPPFGHAYGHYKKHGRKHWGRIRLSDADIINLVNLRFMSDHYGMAPSDVVKMRQEGHGFVDINHTYKEQKEHRQQQELAEKDKPGNGNNQGHGKKHKGGKKK